jgi:hypothetical protein
MTNPNWTTRPQDNIDAAKARVKATLHEPNPKLTTLERAIRQSFLRQKTQHLSRRCDQPPA